MRSEATDPPPASVQSLLATRLSAHPSAPSRAVERIEVRLERSSATSLHIVYIAIGTPRDIVLPSPAAPMRTDNLWRTTCFELFLMHEGQASYREFNFSPSGRWAAYAFRAYRDGMRQAELLGPPIITTTLADDRVTVDVGLSLDLAEERYRLGLSAVIEERRVGTSYWAASHPGERPDFHHPACFTLELPPPAAP